ncbi:MAG: hypothetical protein H0U66_09895 [Gemmatimonadaceae bacterium]|nr:hypothetical protein [Gemmatimonadaceae bacterium]
MAKLTFAVAALLVASVAGTRVQAQSEQFVSDDQTIFVQDAPAGAIELAAPVAIESEPAIVDIAVPVVALEAQAPAPIAATTSVPTGPSTEAATLSPRLASHIDLTSQSMRRPSRGSGVGLMIFGGAALITGLIVGNNAGTVIAVGGALVGLYGLYVYLGRPTGMGNGQSARSERIGLGYKLNTN